MKNDIYVSSSRQPFYYMFVQRTKIYTKPFPTLILDYDSTVHWPKVEHCRQPKVRQRQICSCGRSFAYRKHLNHHQREECGRKFVCSLCFRCCTTKSNMKMHWIKMHAEIDFHENVFTKRYAE